MLGPFQGREGCDLLVPQGRPRIAQGFNPALYPGWPWEVREARALTAADDAKVAKRIALKERQLAVEACEQTYLKGSRFVEAALRAAGFGEYARRVRGVGRPGRPRKKKKRAARRRETANSPSRPSSAAHESFSWTSQALRRARQGFCGSRKPCSAAPANAPATPNDAPTTTIFMPCAGTNELWTSDGTAAGTFLVEDLNPGSGNSRRSR